MGRTLRDFFSVCRQKITGFPAVERHVWAVPLQPEAVPAQRQDASSVDASVALVQQRATGPLPDCFSCTNAC
jgi:hypothetical protein